MDIPRRFLPSISSLLALEAVDRLGSASAAAEELSLTQSAISRQLKVMEEQLDVALIQRNQMRLQLTPAAQEYVIEARAAIQKLAQASLKLKANPMGGSLNLSVLPAFAMHWLAPRLSDFARKHPGVTINLNTRLKPFDFTMEPFDAAIHFGGLDWPGVNALRIMREEVVPVCAPHLCPPNRRSAEWLLDAPLLHLDTRANAWEAWFSAQGISPPALQGMLFDQFSTMIPAAIHGLGVALLPSYLIQDELSSGRLIRAFDSKSISLGDYFLVWPSTRPMPVAFETFHTWLLEQIDDLDPSFG